MNIILYLCHLYDMNVEFGEGKIGRGRLKVSKPICRFNSYGIGKLRDKTKKDNIQKGLLSYG